MKINGIAHRGYSAKHPENTVPSFQAAINLGFSHMELDVHLTKDEIPVVMHDRKIDRMTNGSGEIRHFTLNELRSFTIKGKESIPTLEEVLRLAKGQIIVSIELKNPNLYNNVEKNVLHIIEKTDMMDQVYVISFDHKSLFKVRKLSNKIQVGPLVNKLKRSHFRLVKQLGAHYIAVKHDGIKESYIEKCEKHGIQLIAWTVNTVERMQYYMHFPSVLVTTDELEKFRTLHHQRNVEELQEFDLRPYNVY